MTTRKKLIEVALPLAEINKESAREKIHPPRASVPLHLWWSKPVIYLPGRCFCLVIGRPFQPSPDRFPTEEAQRAERERHISVSIKRLVKWENSNNKLFWPKPRPRL